MEENKSSRQDVRFREPLTLPPLNTQTYSFLTSPQTKEFSIFALAQKHMATKNASPNHILHKYASQSSLSSTTNLLRRHDTGVISYFKDAEPKSGKSANISQRRQQLQSLHFGQSKRSKRQLHRYTSLPPNPTTDTENRSDEDSYDVLGQSLNGRLQKIHLQNPRSIHSRFTLIEDRFLTSTAPSDTQSPRTRTTFHPQPALSKPLSSRETVRDDLGMDDITIEQIQSHQYFRSYIEDTMDQMLNAHHFVNKPFHPKVNNMLTIRQTYNKMSVENYSKHDVRPFQPSNKRQNHSTYRNLTNMKATEAPSLPFKTLINKVRNFKHSNDISTDTHKKFGKVQHESKKTNLNRTLRHQEFKEEKFLVGLKNNQENENSRQTLSPKVRLSATFGKSSSHSSRAGQCYQGNRQYGLHRLPNFADKLRGYGYVFGKSLGTRRRYSENLQRLKSRLKKSRSQGDFGPRLFMPKVRFRKAVRLIILLLRAIFTTRERIQRQEKARKLSMCLNLSDPHMTSKRAYETYGISFDPQDFKANRQIQITPEARNILSMDPILRSSQQLHAVLVSLRQAVPEFSEFPINMQQSLARVGIYERFSAKRVIIRQGHLADNFYFILSGTAVVTLLDIDKLTGEQKARTAAVLGRGKSFGELALMHKARRSATVTCRDDVELLSVGREDFVDIFMHVDRGVDPEHIRFLRTLPMLRGWPLQVLPNDNPKVVLFTYVRKGVVLCRDSNSSEWIYIIKSGSCRIIKALAALPANRLKKSTFSSKPKTLTPIRPRSSRTKSLTRIEEESSFVDEDGSSFHSGETDDLELRVNGNTTPRLSFERDRSDMDEKKSGLQCIQSLDAITDQKHQYNNDSSDESEKDLQEELNCERSIKPCIFVQVLKLGPKDIYGLESSVFSSMKKTISTSLVSDGAEMVMINRKFFMDNTSSELRKRMIKEIHPLPSEESLQNKLQNRKEWESYRTLTLQKTMADMRLIDNYSPRR